MMKSEIKFLGGGLKVGTMVVDEETVGLLQASGWLFLHEERSE